jgi:cobalt-zinc-cadmium efflux system membrane fusion protein
MAVVDVNEENRKLAWYPLRAPFDGTVIDKHLSLGESVKDDSEVFVIADLSTVWAQLQVHRKDLPLISKGQTVTISAGSGIPDVTGVVDYVAPVIDPATRTAEVRVVLDNTSGTLRPGLFVTASVMAGGSHTGTVIAKSAIQYMDDKPCVFVYDGHCYTKRDVVLGKSNGQDAEVLSGLEQGELIVTEGSFHLKAESEKGEMGGHGHAH